MCQYPSADRIPEGRDARVYRLRSDRDGSGKLLLRTGFSWVLYRSYIKIYQYNHPQHSTLNKKTLHELAIMQGHRWICGTNETANIWYHGSGRKDKWKMKIDKFEIEDIEFKYQRLSKVLECIQMAEVEGSGLTDHCLEYALYDVIEGMWENNKRLKKVVDEIVNDRSGQPEAAPL